MSDRLTIQQFNDMCYLSYLTSGPQGAYWNMVNKIFIRLFVRISLIIKKNCTPHRFELQFFKEIRNLHMSLAAPIRVKPAQLQKGYL
jgi:hypothetical protein